MFLNKRKKILIKKLLKIIIFFKTNLNKFIHNLHPILETLQ